MEPYNPVVDAILIYEKELKLATHLIKLEVINREQFDTMISNATEDLRIVENDFGFSESNLALDSYNLWTNIPRQLWPKNI